MTVADGGSVAETAESAVIKSFEEHTATAAEQLSKLQIQLVPREGVVPLEIPRLRMTPVKSEFSLGDITELTPFRKLGESLAANSAA